MMDWEDSNNGAGSDDETDDKWNPNKAVTNYREKVSERTRGSMRGLQTVISAGWVTQRARDMGTFVHDRYRQAAQSEAAALPEEMVAKMSFRVGYFCHTISFCSS